MPVHRGPCFFRVVCHVSLGVCLCMGVSYVYISFREALSMHSKCGIGHEFYSQETSRRQGCELQKKKMKRNVFLLKSPPSPIVRVGVS